MKFSFIGRSKDCCKVTEKWTASEEIIDTIYFWLFSNWLPLVYNTTVPDTAGTGKEVFLYMTSSASTDEFCKTLSLQNSSLRTKVTKQWNKFIHVEVNLKNSCWCFEVQDKNKSGFVDSLDKEVLRDQA